MKDLQTSYAKAHSENLRTGLQDMSNHLRKDILKVEDPKAKALFETSAEVLNGLITTFRHYEEGKEEA